MMQPSRHSKAGKHGFGNQRERNAQIQRIDARPFAGAFLAGGVEDFFHQRFAVFIFEAQNIGGDLNQIAVKLSGVPKLENFVHFIIAQPQAVFHKLVGFANELHIAVFDAVVHHFHEMPCAIAADPIAARLAGRCFGGNRLQNRFT